MRKLLTLLCVAAVGSGCGSDAANPVGQPIPATARSKPPEQKTPVRQRSSSVVEPDAFADVPEAIDALSVALAESDRDSVRRAETWIAGQLAAVQPLADILEDDSADLGLRIAVCRILARIGPSTAPILIENLDSETQLVRLNAARGLGSIQPPNDRIVQSLINLLDDDDERMRLIAIQSLGHIGQAARSAAPQLQKILNSNSNETLRDAASQALRRINPRRTFHD